MLWIGVLCVPRQAHRARRLLQEVAGVCCSSWMPLLSTACFFFLNENDALDWMIGRVREDKTGCVDDLCCCRTRRRVVIVSRGLKFHWIATVASPLHMFCRAGPLATSSSVVTFLVWYFTNLRYLVNHTWKFSRPSVPG
jgi:hypothetical protein